ncbi:hypothetical protein Bsp3421_004925 [Burkholderia sp. FERM BP-3421]|uniref:hypothetical protein n=1 Tax=Burkholderia sp. FERM BP-3421 TaxID=1494466 RepID=UPI00235E2939|nr:hypothetical protein [Burkholderia sp. FERM BP-3421]WDD94782.1 hypothetical protein Bsp3421_004925 [Burkholderia sp. FERM BP-3421]
MSAASPVFVQAVGWALLHFVWKGALIGIAAALSLRLLREADPRARYALLTSVEGETNDYALVRPPGRAPLLAAAYYDAPGFSWEAREAVLREAGAAFVTWATEAA